MEFTTETQTRGERGSLYAKICKKLEVILSNCRNAMGRKTIYFPTFFFHLYHSAGQTFFKNIYLIILFQLNKI